MAEWITLAGAIGMVVCLVPITGAMVMGSPIPEWAEIGMIASCATAFFGVLVGQR